MTPRALILLFTLALCSRAQETDFLRTRGAEALPAPLNEAAASIDSVRLRAHLAYLSDPKREGRGLGTRGLDATVAYLEHQLKTLGLKPLGKTYRQAVPLREVRPGGGSVRLKTAAGDRIFLAGRDAILPPLEPGLLSGPLVYVGYGIQEPSLQHDDFRDVDVRGKVVVFRDGTPGEAIWRRPDLVEKYTSPRPADRYDSRLALLEKLGAKAAIALEPGLEQRLREGKEPALPYFLAAKGLPGSGEPPLVRLSFRPELPEQLTAGGTANLELHGRVRSLQGVNLLAQLEGSDPTLRRSAILLGAHMDHLGMPGGVLHPGADDNASGVAALLEIIRVATTALHRPRRTLLFAFWTGEEEGKFGSGQYTRQPRWPLARTEAYLNLDMVGHPWTAADLRALVEGAGLKDPAGFLAGLDPADFVEPGLPPGHPELAAALVHAGRGTGLSLHLDWTDGRSGGSDYRDFARLNVPFIRFFGSYFPEYHKPGDTLDKLDPDQVRRMARLALGTAWLLADR